MSFDKRLYGLILKLMLHVKLNTGAGYVPVLDIPQI